MPSNTPFSYRNIDNNLEQETIVEPNQQLSQPYPQHNDEIDLVELFRKLWEQRVVIGSITGVITLIGIAYAFLATPIYQARAQLQIPTAAELASINSASFYNITPEKLFSQFLAVLESDSHQSMFLKANAKLIEEKLAIKGDASAKESFAKIRRIVYPKKQDNNTIEPDIYSISLDGAGKDALAKLLDNDIYLATQTTIQKIQEDFQQIRLSSIKEKQQQAMLLTAALAERRKNKIIQLKEHHHLQKLKLNDQIKAQKTYVLNIRKVRIESLKQAINIAKQLKIIEPITLSKLATSGVNHQVEINADINNKKEPLYLTGTRLLSAELENLVSMPDNLLLDDKIIKLETDLLKLKHNRDIETLISRKSDSSFSEELQKIREQLTRLQQASNLDKTPNISFQNSQSTLASEVLKPKKRLVIAISVIIGIIFGIFIAAVKLINRERN